MGENNCVRNNFSRFYYLSPWIPIMSYVDKTLGENEKIFYRVNFHWLYSLTAIVSLLILGWLIIGIIIFAVMMINKWTTERVLTDFRFIKKTGWILRNTEEIRIDRTYQPIGR